MDEVLIEAYKVVISRKSDPIFIISSFPVPENIPALQY
jgi:hypothetical protein